MEILNLGKQKKKRKEKKEYRLNDSCSTGFDGTVLLSVARNIILILLTMSVIFKITYWYCVSEIDYLSFVNWASIWNLCYIKGFEHFYCIILFTTALLVILFVHNSTTSKSPRGDAGKGSKKNTGQTSLTKHLGFASIMYVALLLFSFWGNLTKIHTGILCCLVLPFITLPFLFNNKFLTVSIPHNGVRATFVYLFCMGLIPVVLKGVSNAESKLGRNLSRTYITVDSDYLQSIKSYKSFLTSKAFQKDVVDKSKVLYLGALGGDYIFVPIKDYSGSIPKYTDFLRLGKGEIQPFMFEKTSVVRAKK